MSCPRVSALPFLLGLFLLLSPGQSRAEEPIRPDKSRAQLEQLWRARIQSFLDRGVIPLVDMESSLPNKDADGDLGPALAAMDREGVALLVCDGYQADKQGEEKGYRWGYAVHRAANRHPDRIVLATNGGSSPNWTKGRGGTPEDFMDQTEVQARSGDYPIMGEFEFRHYLSSDQCRKGHTERNVDLPLDGENGRRLFALSTETGLVFLIHLEPEDAPLEALEKMLAAYPQARVIVCHFGQVRFPARQTKFKPALVRRLLSTYPNLYYDLSVGEPNRRYACNDNVLDTVIWGELMDRQTDALRPDYAALFTEFSTRFVSGFDYGGGRPALPGFIRDRAENMRRILAKLPEAVQRDIAYRNAWRLLTGKDWD